MTSLFWLREGRSWDLQKKAIRASSCKTWQTSHSSLSVRPAQCSRRVQSKEGAWWDPGWHDRDLDCTRLSCKCRITYLRFSCDRSIIVHPEPAIQPVSEQCDTMPVPQLYFVFTCYKCSSSATVKPGSRRQRGQGHNFSLTKYWMFLDSEYSLHSWESLFFTMHINKQQAN